MVPLRNGGKMVHSRTNYRKKYYFSDKLKKQLVQMSHYPTTIIEAPSGFGKTTAVREFLSENLFDDSSEYWYTCLVESTSMAWEGICELLSNVSTEVADELKNLKTPTMDTLLYITSRLRGLYCQKETYLVIDNYQLVNIEIPRELISVFSMHGNPKLHIIFITQQLEFRQQILIHNDNIHIINAPSFFFDKKGIASLFRMEGIRLTDDELESIYISTEGWVSAIRLQILNYIETGSFDFNLDIQQLVEKAIWNKLTSRERNFFLSVSVLDNFSMNQAAILVEEDMLSEEKEELLKNNDFIRYLSNVHRYSMHSILQDYLRNRFYYLMPKEFQEHTFRKAGKACVATSQYYPAAEFFYKVKDFNSILELPFSIEYLDTYKEKYQADLIVMIINECPEETWYAYPFPIVIFGYYLFKMGEIVAYRRLCKILEAAILLSTDWKQDLVKEINSKFILLSSLGDFNDISKMIVSHRKAWEILGKPEHIVKPFIPFLQDVPSILNMLWRESGKLKNVIYSMEESVSLYQKMGEGSGAYYMIQAEAKLMQGKDEEAEILSFKALADARSYQQTNICLCAESTLIRIAILRGDSKSYFARIENLHAYGKSDSNPYVQRLVEYVISVISFVLGIKENISPWIYDMASIKKVLYAPLIPFAEIIYLKTLLMDKRYNKFYGTCQLALDKFNEPIGNIRYMMPKIYQLIFMASAKRKNGNDIEAQQYLKRALDIAMEDQIFLPFATEENIVDMLCEMNMNSTLNSLRALCQRQQKGANAIKKAINKAKSPLTPREREIAQLARERYTAKEIAGMLYISDQTVRATLRNVYSKLNINSKAQLSYKEF